MPVGRGFSYVIKQGMGVATSKEDIKYTMVSSSLNSQAFKKNSFIVVYTGKAQHPNKKI
jgi:hypothetical protein